jgi:transcriptional regulator NrdR family protein
VLDTRDVGSGFGEHTRRRRECRRCGFRFTMREEALGQARDPRPTQVTNSFAELD